MLTDTQFFFNIKIRNSPLLFYFKNINKIIKLKLCFKI